VQMIGSQVHNQQTTHIFIHLLN